MPTQARLRELFDYDPERGCLLWKVSNTNSVKVGQVAGSLRGSDGYWVVGVDKAIYPTHRLIWVWHYGSLDQDLFIDHINGDKLDNRVENLRTCSHAENGRNRPGKQSSNTSGYSGVCWDKKSLKWRAQIQDPQTGGKRHLGLFTDLHKAALTAAKARVELFGDFAPPADRDLISYLSQLLADSLQLELSFI